ncbi:MAG: OB-fold nucleic acid binding domain-containing protein [Candidatus Nanoarchaeia archaeon]|nr:OB-fold nucleic acid binding domain-containing protein [Candidatus Nanoarchaeia archaeon]
MTDGQKRRSIAYEKEICDLTKDDVRVRVTGTVIEKQDESSSIVLDDGTGQVTIMLPSDEFLENINPGMFLRVIGMIIPYGEGVELRGELIQDFSKANKDIYTKYRMLAKLSS